MTVAPGLLRAGLHQRPPGRQARAAGAASTACEVGPPPRKQIWYLRRSASGRGGLAPPSRQGETYNEAVASTSEDCDRDLPPLSFQDQVALWLEVWTADRPELRDQARAVADPSDDPWGYLVALGELVLVAD